MVAVVDQSGSHVCIVQPFLPRASETFIRAHAEELPLTITVLHGNPPRIGTSPPFSPSAIRWCIRRLNRLKSASGHESELTERYTRALRRIRPDVVLAEYGPTGCEVRSACERLRIPLVVHFHGYDATRKDVIEQYAPAYRRMFAYASGIIAVSKEMQRRLLDLGAPSGKLHHIVYGIDCNKFSGANPRTAEPVFLACGRFVEKKAPYLTLSAFARAAEQNSEIRLRMIGDGPLLGPCRDLARLWGIDNRVEFLGEQTPAQVQQEMQRARGFVQHSIQASDGDCEGTPVAILEAGASGLPVVATRHAGIPDVVLEGTTGLLVDEKDVDGMAKYLVSLANDRELASRLGSNAVSHITGHFSSTASITKLNAVLLHCIQDGTRRENHSCSTESVAPR